MGSSEPGDRSREPDRRNSQADERDHVADERQRQADVREHTADERQGQADDRESTADLRDEALDRREAGIGSREVELNRLLGVGEARIAALVSEIDGLHTAMDSRAVIEQAKGVIMHTMHCGPDAAFAVLVAQSQAQNIKLRDIAAAIAARQDR